MSKDKKVLTLMGRKAVWAPGGGGGVQVVTATITNDETVKASHTGAEIIEMAKKGCVIMCPDADMGEVVMPLVTATEMGGAVFLMVAGTTISSFQVAFDSTSVEVHALVS